MAGAQADPLDRPVVLVGFMGAGKSTVGQLLAERLDVPFVDTDAEIERAFGAPITDIFRTGGEAAFREAERQLISHLLANGRQVIAVGGGAFVDASTREALLHSAHTVWLDPSFDVIASRLARSTKRPLVSSRSEDELRQLWEERRSSYARAHVRFAISDGDPEGAVDRIVSMLAGRER